MTKQTNKQNDEEESTSTKKMALTDVVFTMSRWPLPASFANWCKRLRLNRVEAVGWKFHCFRVSFVKKHIVCVYFSYIICFTPRLEPSHSLLPFVFRSAVLLTVIDPRVVSFVRSSLAFVVCSLLLQYKVIIICTTLSYYYQTTTVQRWETKLVWKKTWLNCALSQNRYVVLCVRCPCPCPCLGPPNASLSLSFSHKLSLDYSLFRWHALRKSVKRMKRKPWKSWKRSVDKQASKRTSTRIFFFFVFAESWGPCLFAYSVKAPPFRQQPYNLLTPFLL